MRYIRADLLRATESKRFGMTVLFASGIMMLQAEHIYRMTEVEQRLGKGFWLQLLNHVLHNQRTVLFFAAISGIVYAASLREDAESRFYYFYFSREDRLQYIKGKIAVNFMAINLVFLSSCIFCGIGQYLLLSPGETVEDTLKIRECVGAIVAVVGNYILFNWFWAAFAMLLSYAMKSMYLAYLSPFIGFYFLVIMNQRFFRKLKIMNPYLWVLKGSEWYGGRWGQLILLFLLCALVNCVIAVVVYKRYEHG